MATMRYARLLQQPKVCYSATAYHIDISGFLLLRQPMSFKRYTKHYGPFHLCCLITAGTDTRDLPHATLIQETAATEQ